jgi:alpha-tubulin suppressor-like RCC1 family protein
LGDNLHYRGTPTRVPTLSNIIQIASSMFHSFAVNKLGQIYAFGLNANGELGLGDVNNRGLPTLNPYLNNIVKAYTGTSFSIVMNNTGFIFSFGFNVVKFIN